MGEAGRGRGLTLRNLALYLVGNAGAIRAIASDRWSLPVGFLLVLSAGLARNYDGAYLAAEWSVLFHGIGASVVNSLILYSVVYLAAMREREGDVTFVSGYLSFLGLFWLTAPMAWLYALPYERWMTEGDAVRANLVTLGMVSLWRIALMARTLTILFRVPWIPVTLITLAFADLAVLLAVILMPKPVLDVMGGLQHTDADATLLSTTLNVGFFSLILGPVLFIAAIIGVAWMKSGSTALSPRWGAPPRGPLVLAILALLAWIPALLHTQPEQKNRFRAESLLREERIAEALAEMSMHPRSSFPPIWDPPPRMGYGESKPDIELIRAELARGRHARWVEAVYLDKLWRSAMRSLFHHDYSFEKALERMASEEGSFADGIAPLAPTLRLVAERHPGITPRERESLLAIIERAELAAAAQDSGLEPPARESPDAGGVDPEEPG